MTDFVVTLFCLVVIHSLVDFHLQGEFLAKAKDRTSEVGKSIWVYALGAHSMLHAGGVYVVTGSVTLGLWEAIAHFLTDDAKCRGAITANQDQAIHIACKVAWAAVAVYWGPLA